MLRQTATATLLAASTFLAVGCDQAVDNGELAYAKVPEYVDGVTARTSLGAFEVTLFSEEGAVSSGANVMYARVAMRDPSGDAGQGWGIPNANIAVDVSCDEQPRSAADARITYTGDGTYELADLQLGSGTCELYFDIAVGETVTDDVSFFFTVE